MILRVIHHPHAAAIQSTPISCTTSLEAVLGRMPALAGRFYYVNLSRQFEPSHPWRHLCECAYRVCYAQSAVVEPLRARARLHDALVHTTFFALKWCVSPAVSRRTRFRSALDPASRSWSHRTARARTIYGTLVAMTCEAAVRIEAGCGVGFRLRVRKVRTELYLVSIICIVSACAGEFTMCQAWYMSKVYATALA